jgi:hypothetical protein
MKEQTEKPFIVVGVNQQPPVHQFSQFRMRQFKPFWG